MNHGIDQNFAASLLILDTQLHSSSMFAIVLYPTTQYIWEVEGSLIGSTDQSLEVIQDIDRKQR